MHTLRPARRRTLLAALILFYLHQEARAQDPFDCHVALDGGLNYDLTSIAGEHVVTRTRSTPPSKLIDEVRFDLCSDLQRRDGIADQDQVGFRSSDNFMCLLILDIHLINLPFFLFAIVSFGNASVYDNDKPKRRRRRSGHRSYPLGYLFRAKTRGFRGILLVYITYPWRIH